MSAFVIAGPGAVGVALGFHLQKSGHIVSYIGREGPAPVRARLTTFGAGGADTADLAFVAYSGNPGADAVSSPAALPQAVFFCVKANDLLAALQMADGMVPAQTVFVVLCNGVVDEVIQSWVRSVRTPERPTRGVRLGICTVGVTQAAKTGKNTGKVTGSQEAQGLGKVNITTPEFTIRSTTGGWTWGALIPPRAEILPWEAELFETRSFHWTPDARGLVRTKWLINTVVNSIAGAYRLPDNGAILNMMDVFDETFAEALKLGRELWGPWQQDDLALKNMILNVIRDTAQNENSLARDIRLRRPTESPWFAGLAANRLGFARLNELHQKIMAAPHEPAESRANGGS